MVIRSLRREPGFYHRLWRLSLPIILQNLITTSLGFADTFMVGLLGNAEMAAVTALDTKTSLFFRHDTPEAVDMFVGFIKERAGRE